MKQQHDTLTQQFLHLSHLLMNVQRRGRMEAAGNKDASRRRLLAIIAAHPALTEKELVRILSHRALDAEEYVEKLVALGLIARTDSGGIELTDQGRQESGRCLPDTVFSCLSDTEQETLQGYLTRVLEQAEAMQDSDDEWGSRGCIGHFGPAPGMFRGGFPGHGHAEGFDPRDGDRFRGFGICR